MDESIPTAFTWASVCGLSLFLVAVLLFRRFRREEERQRRIREAQEELAKAYEEGDPEKIAAAVRKLNDVNQ